MSKSAGWFAIALVAASHLTGCVMASEPDEVVYWDDIGEELERQAKAAVPAVSHPPSRPAMPDPTSEEAWAPAPREYQADDAITFEREGHERTHGVRIGGEPKKQKKVIYSIQLLDLHPSERLRLRAEVTLSRCNEKDIAGESSDSKVTPCDSKKMKQEPYGYNPRFKAAFVLASSPDDPNGTVLSKWFGKQCTKQKHHCALAVPEIAIDNPPAAAQTYLNLVVSADSAGAPVKSWHVMEVEQQKGGLYVTRLGPTANDNVDDEKTLKLVTTKKMSVHRPKQDGGNPVKELIYQIKLEGLQPGDVIDADARMHAHRGDYQCNPLITSEILLSEDPTARTPSGPADGLLTRRNGFNCHKSNSGCEYDKSGAVRLGALAPSTMYLSYLATALRSCADPSGANRWHVAPKGGALQAHVRRGKPAQSTNKIAFSHLPVHRAYHTEQLKHLYSNSLQEIENASGVQLEFKNYFWLYAGGKSSSTPLYRCYLGNDNHLLTVAADCEGNPGAMVGSLGNIATQELPGSVALYRLYHGGGGNYFYTIDPAEAQLVVGYFGYVLEGTAGWVIP